MAQYGSDRQRPRQVTKARPTHRALFCRIRVLCWLTSILGFTVYTNWDAPRWWVPGSGARGEHQEGSFER